MRAAFPMVDSGSGAVSLGGIVADGDPFRNLAAAILSRAVVDLKSTREAVGARRFLRGAWAQCLCTALDIDHQAVVEKLKL